MTALLLGLIITSTSRAQNQVQYIEFEDLIIYDKPPVPGAPSSPSGNCYGAPCLPPTKNQPAGPAERQGSDPRNPYSGSAEGSTSTAKRPEQLPFSEFRDFVLGERSHGVDDPRFGIISGFGPGEPPIMGNISQFEGTLRTLASRNLTVPPALTASYAERVSALSRDVALSRTVSVPQSLLLPPLPTSTELRALVVKLFDASFPDSPKGGKLQDRKSHHDRYFAQAQDNYVTEVRGELSKVEANLAKVQNEVAIAIGRQADRGWPELTSQLNATNSEIAIFAKEMPRRTTGAATVDELSLKGTLAYAPESLKRNYFILPSGPIRDSLERTDWAAHGFERERPATPDFARTFTRIDSYKPTSPQGRLGKFLAEYLAVEANRERLYGGRENWVRAERSRKDAEAILDLVSSFLPVVSTARDIFELYTGTNLITGAPLERQELAILTVSVASIAFGNWAPRPAVRAILRQVRTFSEKLRLPRSFSFSRSAGRIAAELNQFSERWPDVVDKLRAASAGVHDYKVGGRPVDFTVGKVSANEMDLLGRAWVGFDATKIVEADKGVTIYLSRDLRSQYRSAAFKNKEQKVRANLQKRLDKEGPWISNAHFDVVP